MTESVVQLIAQAMAALRAVGKDSKFTGPGGFNFRGIDATVNAVGPVFRELGIVGPVPELLSCDYREVTSKDKVGQRACVRVKYSFYGPNGDSMECIVPGEAMDWGDKATAKAMSVACRIALLQTLCLPTQEPDPDSYVEGRSEADIARDQLIDKMTRLKLNPDTVIQAYSELYGADPRTDDNVENLRNFTNDMRRP